MARTIASPLRDMPPITSVSPDWYLVWGFQCQGQNAPQTPLSFFAPRESWASYGLKGPHGSRRAPTEQGIRHEAEPASIGGGSLDHRATSLYSVRSNEIPNHDADIRIGSEAPKQRCPFCSTVCKPYHRRCASNRYLGSSLADRRLQAPVRQT